MKQATCDERITKELTETMEYMRAFARGETMDDGETTFEEYGLSFDYVESYTFDDQPEGYWRYQLSWGGPSDEFRFFVNDGSIRRIEYWFLDWFDGAHRELDGDDFETMRTLYDRLRGWD